MPTAKAPPPQSQTKQSEANKTQAVPALQKSVHAGQPGQPEQAQGSSSPSTVWNWQGRESLANFRRNCDILRPRARDLVRQLEACPFPAQSESAILPANNDSNAKPLNLPRSRPQELMAAEAAAINVQKKRATAIGFWFFGASHCIPATNPWKSVKNGLQRTCAKRPTAPSSRVLDSATK